MEVCAFQILVWSHINWGVQAYFYYGIDFTYHLSKESKWLISAHCQLPMSVLTDSGCYHIQLPWLTWLQPKTDISMPIRFLKITVAPYTDYLFSGVRCLLLTFPSRQLWFTWNTLKTGNQTQMWIGKLKQSNPVCHLAIKFQGMLIGTRCWQDQKRPYLKYFTKQQRSCILFTNPRVLAWYSRAVWNFKFRFMSIECLEETKQNSCLQNKWFSAQWIQGTGLKIYIYIYSVSAHSRVCVGGRNLGFVKWLSRFLPFQMILQVFARYIHTCTQNQLWNIMKIKKKWNITIIRKGQSAPGK